MRPKFDADCYGDIHTDEFGNEYPNRYVDINSREYAYCNGDEHAYGNGHCNSDKYSNGDCNSDCNADPIRGVSAGPGLLEKRRHMARPKPDVGDKDIYQA